MGGGKWRGRGPKNRSLKITCFLRSIINKLILKFNLIIKNDDDYTMMHQMPVDTLDDDMVSHMLTALEFLRSKFVT